MNRSIGAGWLVMVSAAMFGQPAPPAFEVASIKLHEGPLRRVFGYSSSGPRVTLEAFNVLGLVMEA